jgi:hypothetical protein
MVDLHHANHELYDLLALPGKSLRACWPIYHVNKNKLDSSLSVA